MKKVLSLALILSATQGCAVIDTITLNNTLGEDGKVWCNTRYHKPGTWLVNESVGEASQKGYIYGVASALALQSEDGPSKAHWFKMPERLHIIDQQTHTLGFDRMTFLLHPLHDEEPVVIIAFAGSNDSVDWFGANLFQSKTQYRQAYDYTLKMLEDERVKGKKVVLVGTSLGGALALYTGWNKAIEKRISSIWAFNPSPLLHGAVPNDESINKTWVVYAEKEGLALLRRNWIDKYQLKESQSISLSLVEANLWYSHYRWGVARQMLWVADYELTQRNTQTAAWTEPLAILDKSEFHTCEKKVRPRYKVKEALQPTQAKPSYAGH